MSYFRDYLEVAPLSLALWRGIEAYEVEKIDFQPPVLDLGCGFGEFAGVFFDSKVEVGLDISKKDVEKAIKGGKYKKVIAADARRLPFPPRSFTTVISISTLEHIGEVEEVFSEVYRVLKREGRFIFTVPTSSLHENLFFSSLFKRIGLENFGKLYFQAFNKAFKHKSIFSPDVWKVLVEKADFEVEYSGGTVSRKAVRIFELFLLAALPTQLFKLLLARRLLFSPKWRVKLLYRFFNGLVEVRDGSRSNVLIVARKVK